MTWLLFSYYHDDQENLIIIIISKHLASREKHSAIAPTIGEVPGHDLNINCGWAEEW